MGRVFILRPEGPSLALRSSLQSPTTLFVLI
jgi:hypothetical protein